MTENNKKGTLFSRLQNVLFKSVEIDTRDLTKTTFTPELNKNPDDNVIISKQELEILQQQQQRYLNAQSTRVQNQRYDRQTYYEFNRLSVYYELEQMEFDPRIARALDLYAEEACTQDITGRVIQVNSDNPRIKNALESFLYGGLDIETNCIPWIRDLCKYGEIFFYRKIQLGTGIVDMIPLPGIEIEIRTEEDGNKKHVVYEHGIGNIKYAPLEISHIRLLGETRYFPYGVSMLDKSRRIWNQLRLAEDSMLVYRAVRAPERRIFKVFVGNIDSKDVLPYMEEYKRRMKGDAIVNPSNGNVDLRAKFLSLDQDYFIPVRDQGAGSVIETLPGASNLNEIADVEYFQRNLLTSLAIPKAYLGFDEAAGAGKNLAMEDLRFANTIKRIQNSFISGIKELCQVHLFSCGFEEEYNQFTLSMTSSSIQSKKLQLEILKESAETFKSLTDGNNGIAPFSITNAKKLVFGLSEEEIMTDLYQQRVENAVKVEMEQIKETIKSTHIFDRVDKKMEFKKISGDTETTGGDSFGGGGDMFGGGSSSSSSSSGGLSDLFGGGSSGTDIGGTTPATDTSSVTPESYKVNYGELLNETPLMNFYENLIKPKNIVNVNKKIKTSILNEMKTYENNINESFSPKIKVNNILNELVDNIDLIDKKINKKVNKKK